MNERIKQLAEQALREVTEHGFSDAVYRPDGFAASASKAFADRFAELIVRECINKVNEVGYKSANNISTDDTELFKNVLKSHFGVEE